MEDDADDDGEGNLNETGEDGGGVSLKDRSDDEAEDGENNGEGEKEDGEEKDACATGKDASGDIAYGLTLVAKRDYEGSEVVDGSDEDGTEENPEKGGHPAPDHGESGADDGTGAGDGREVMPKDDGLAGGNVVVAVFELDGGRGAIGIELKNFL